MWEEIGFGQVPSTIVKAGLGHDPMTDGLSWYCKSGDRFFRTGLGLARRTGLGDLTDSGLEGYAQQIVSSPPGASTNTTVNLFQQSYNAQGGSPQLVVDGLYGPNTQAAVQAVLNANNDNQTAPPAAVSAGGGGGGGGGSTTLPTQTVVGSAAPNTTGMLIWGAVGGVGGGLLGYFVSHAFRGPRMHIRAYTAVGAVAGAGVGGYFGSKS